jgi:hypothetical protein
MGQSGARPIIPRDLPCGHKLARIPAHPSGLGKCVMCGAVVDLADYPPALVRDYLSFYAPPKPPVGADGQHTPRG